MIAWTSPGFTVRLMPLRISLSPAEARRSLISSTWFLAVCIVSVKVKAVIDS